MLLLDKRAVRRFAQLSPLASEKIRGAPLNRNCCALGAFVTRRLSALSVGIDRRLNYRKEGTIGDAISCGVREND